MPTPPPNEITQLLLRWSRGDRAALDQLMPVVYEELHKLAHSYLRRERADHTLQPTALVNEAYLRLVKQQNALACENRQHFFGVAAYLMRQILVQHARAHMAAKRGGGVNFHLEDVLTYTDENAAEMVALDDALLALAKFDERKARIIELRYFGGMSLAETAEALGLSVATINNETRLARAWLHRELSRD
ncbi:MAG TPA: ECF-type sigma factor [Blastocatellia bacterium]|nr:ECF-type sigma factor [Blastocatellia bacterium]